MYNLKYTLAVFFLSLIVFGCATNRSITSLENEKYFKESPKIVKVENRCYLKFTYADNNDTWGFAMFTESKIENNSVIFCLPVTTSSGDMRGKTQHEEIITANKVELINKGSVFWEDPDGTLRQMTIDIIQDGLELMKEIKAQKTH